MVSLLQENTKNIIPYSRNSLISGVMNIRKKKKKKWDLQLVSYKSGIPLLAGPINRVSTVAQICCVATRKLTWTSFSISLRRLLNSPHHAQHHQRHLRMSRDQTDTPQQARISCFPYSVGWSGTAIFTFLHTIMIRVSEHHFNTVLILTPCTPYTQVAGRLISARRAK